MNSRFDRAFRYTIQNEGGFSNDPHDAGGATRYGISSRLLSSLKDCAIKDVRTLTLEDAKQIYKAEFYDKIKGDEFPSDRIVIKLFDTAVNVGVRTAVKILQTAINKMAARVAVDGVIGRLTISATDTLLKAFVSEQINFYKTVAERIPTQRKFLNGWINRARRLP